MAVRRKMLEEFKDIRALDYWEIERALDSIKSNNAVRDRALISFLFLSGCRISEVVNYKRQGKIEGLPMVKRQIELTPEFIVIHDVRTLKRRKKFNRVIPIMATSEREQPFINAVMHYLITLGDDAPLFDMTRQNAFLIVERAGLFPHLLRHSRNTINMRYYNMTAYHLQRFNGWGDTRSGDSYVHLNVGDIMQTMKQSQTKNNNGDDMNV